MTSAYSRDAAKASADTIRARIGDEPPDIAIILGSGLGGLADEIRDEGVDVSFGRLPGAHQAPGVTGETMEHPTASVEALHQRFGKVKKHAVGFDRKCGRKVRFFFQSRRQQSGAAIAVSGMFQPDVVLQHRKPGRSVETHFGGQLPGLFATIFKFGSENTIEENHGLGIGQAELGAAKAQYVHTDFPR